MDAELWKRLGYPRRLKDGSFAVTVGFFGDWYRLKTDEFERYVNDYARPLYIDGLRDGGFAIGFLCLFILPAGVGLAGLLLCSAPGLLLWAINVHARAIRFGAEFRPVRNVEVLDHRWSGYELCVASVRNRHAVAWGIYSLVLGRMTAEAYPHTLMQFAPFLGWPAYAVLSGVFFAAGVVLLGMRVYYKATRGCRLSPENIGKIEVGAAFLIRT
ncbi:MAG: hypothetical protein IH626_12030 [Rhodospirillales bacterium]|nr:hypothetical protein [Rhodospirillales bacterium]